MPLSLLLRKKVVLILTGFQTVLLTVFEYVK